MERRIARLTIYLMLGVLSSVAAISFSLNGNRTGVLLAGVVTGVCLARLVKEFPR